jgi:hypothetical protein
MTVRTLPDHQGVGLPSESMSLLASVLPTLSKIKKIINVAEGDASRTHQKGMENVRQRTRHLRQSRMTKKEGTPRNLEDEGHTE